MAARPGRELTGASAAASASAGAPTGRGVSAALGALLDSGSASGVCRNAPRIAAQCVGLDRVLLTRVVHGSLVAVAVHVTGLSDAERGALLETLRVAPAPLAYPCSEGELLRRRSAAVLDGNGGVRSAAAFGQLLGWRRYVAAPVPLESRVDGFLQGDRVGGTTDGHDAAALWDFARVLAVVWDRALLREQLRREQRRLRDLAGWIAASAHDLDAYATAGEDASAGAGAAAERVAAGERPQRATGGVRELLTRRELDVAELMARGDTNAAIARELVLSAGTVKFHVKNVLRKLHATNRAQATASYLRLTLDRDRDRDAASRR